MKINHYKLLVTCLIWVSVIPLPVLADADACPRHEPHTEEKLKNCSLVIHLQV